MNPYNIGAPASIDRAALAAWNEANTRAREEYAANPHHLAGNGRCGQGGCNKATGNRRFCWQHRILRRAVES